MFKALEFFQPKSVADPGFPVGGGHGPRTGGRGPPRQLHFKYFACQNERIWTHGGGAPGAPPLDPPMQVPCQIRQAAPKRNQPVVESNLSLQHDRWGYKFATTLQRLMKNICIAFTLLQIL